MNATPTLRHAYRIEDTPGAGPWRSADVNYFTIVLFLC